MNRFVLPATLIGGAALVAVAAAAEAPQFKATATESAEGARIALTPEGDAPLPAATAQLAGGVLVVRFAAPVEGDVSGLTRAAPRTIAAARREGDGKTLRLSLRRSLTPALTREDGAAIIALTPAAEAPPGEAKAALDAPVAAPTASLSVGSRPDLTRLSFLFNGGATVTPVRSGSRLELRFSRAAEIDLSQLRASPPLFVRSAERVSRPGARLAIALTLEDGVKVRQFAEGSRVVVDLTAPDKPTVTAAAPPPPPPPPARLTSDPAPRGGSVPVAVEEGADETRLTLNWAGPARAAAFRRGDAAWLLFETNAQFDIRGARKTEITPVRGEGVAGLRIAAPPGAQLSARVQGNAWIFTLGPRQPTVDPAPVKREVAAGQGRLVVDFGRDGVVKRITDPAARDVLSVALVGGPPRGIAGRRTTPDAVLLDSIQGAAMELRGDGVGAQFENRQLVIGRGEGEGTPLALEEVAPLDSAAFLDVRREAAIPNEQVLPRLAELQRRAASEGTAEGARVEARLALARFLVAHELSAEALGALRVAKINQPQLDVDPQFRLMRAAASVMLGRLKAAKNDLDAGALAEDPAAALWRGYVAAQERDWTTARRELARGRTALALQPKGWRAKFELALSTAALELQDVEGAAAATARALAANPDSETAGFVRIAEARVVEARGNTRAALAAMKQLSTAPNEMVAVRATYEAARLERSMGAAEAQTIETLEALRLRWRGDALELEITQQLAAIYAERGRWRDALVALRGAAAKHAEHPLGRALRADMSDLFERLYLDGEADKLQPVQALGLFYDFKELTPVGPNGDRMVRNLAGRLVALDLLEQAAALLQHQVEERLEGVGRAQIAADLAMIYLRDRKPEKALTAIELSRQPNMPADLLATRRILEAKAYLDLGRTEQAVEILERDRSAEGQRIRAEAAWKERDWPRAAAELRQVLVMRPRNAPWTDEDRNIILRTAIAMTFAADARGISTLRKDYASVMAGSSDATSFEVVSQGIDANGAQLRDLARTVARTDLLDRFLSDLKSRMAAKAAPRTAQAATPPRA
jgi:tetratricopeptide (TPR) repeat protein